MELLNGCGSCCESRGGAENSRDRHLVDENAGIDYETQRALDVQEINRLSLNTTLTETIVGGKLVAVLCAPWSPEERLDYNQRWQKLTRALEVCAAKYEMLAISPIYNNIYEAQLEALYGYTGALPALFVGLEPISADEADEMLQRGELIGKLCAAGVRFKNGDGPAQATTQEATTHRAEVNRVANPAFGMI